MEKRIKLKLKDLLPYLKPELDILVSICRDDPESKLFRYWIGHAEDLRKIGDLDTILGGITKSTTISGIELEISKDGIPRMVIDYNSR